MPSWGILLPTRGAVMADTPTEVAARTRSDVLDLALAAEEYGFDAVWVGDSVLARPRLAALPTLAAVAGATERVTLGTAVYLPGLRHAVHVAHQTATLSQLSGGRLVLGVGVGTGEPVRREHAQLGLEYERRGETLDECLAVLTRLWAGEPVTHDRRGYRLDGATLGFEPVSPPPIYVASLGFDPTESFPRRVRERLVTYGDGWLPAGLAPEGYAVGLERVGGFLAAAGRDPATVDPAVYLDVAVADSREAALEETRDFLLPYFPEWDDLPAEYAERRGAFGTPADVAATLERYREAGAERFVLRLTAADQHEQLGRVAALLELD